jgi:hypothetical protein
MVAKQVFACFKNVRDKHLVHDESAYAQSIPSAALNRADATHKIAKIFAMAVDAETLDQGNYGNLHLLIDVALKWVIGKFDELACLLTEELEAEKYEDLLARRPAEVRIPTAKELEIRRKTP